MRTTEHIAGAPSTPNTGLLAALRALLGVKGTGAPSVSLKGTGAPSFAPRLPLVAVLGALALLALAVSVAPASAETGCSTCKPWWHLTSNSRPSYLHSGLAKPGANEVQEIFTTPGTIEGFPEQTNFKLYVEKKEVEEFATEPVAGAFSVTLLTAANIQKALEGKNKPNNPAYGPGNVTVKEETLDKNGKPLENGDKRYLVTTVGEKAEQPVTPIEAKEELPSTATPSVLTAGLAPVFDGELAVTAENLGDANASGATTPVVIRDVLPAGLTALGVSGTEPFPGGEYHKRLPLSCSLESPKVVTCEAKSTLAPYDSLEMRVAVRVEPGAKECAPHAPTCEKNEATVTGGEAQGATIARPVTISSAPTPFGVEDYELLNEDEGGAPDTHAGSHPFQQTNTIVLNQSADTAALSNPEIEANPAALAKDLSISWPPGLIGNPTPIPRCTIAQFLTIVTENGEENECPADSAVGVANVTVRDFTLSTTLRFPVPLFNLEPAAGEPARLGFYVILGNSPVIIDPSLRSGGDYGITVNSFNITQTAGFVSAQVTVWGTPQDPSHDNARGWGCLFTARGSHIPHAPCVASRQQHPPPFLSLPTSCANASLSTIEGDSWLAPGVFSRLAEYTEPKLDGCNQLPFEPQIEVKPDGQQASRPTGLLVDVHVPQEGQLNPTGDAESNIRSIRVVLPEGVILNPAAADGLQACPESLIGFEAGRGTAGFQEFEPGVRTPLFTGKLPEPLEAGVNFCPDASKVGTATIKTPLLPNPLEGAVYLATPAPNGEEGNNPFNSTVAMYIVARDPVSGSLVKLPGKVTLNQETGRIESTFEDTPQLAFEDAEIHFFGGERAPLATPAHCGTYTTEAEFTPWSGTPPVKSTSSFEVKTGPGGGPCPPAALPFTAQLQAGSPNINAGGFSPLDTTISREDGNQNIQTVQLHMAPGMSGILAGVPLCPEAQANAGTCGEESKIGETIVSVGLGGDPYTVTGGKVYLTERYQGAPFGLSIVNPADAGPFHLGKVIVRAKIEIDPRTAALTITTGEIPHILKGFPLEIKHVNVTINRPNFTFNPTNCTPMSITGTIGAVEGATSLVSDPFQVTNCALLKFGPQIAVTTAAKASKVNGASLLFKIAYPKGALGSQSWFNEAKFDLPKQLPARLTTIQKACLAATFESNRSACPPASIIGHAVVHTPVLPVPLEGPVYFVSYGGAKFPDAVLVLDGYGVHIELHGETFIEGKTGLTSATFRNTPDVPFESIEVSIPTGPHSEFGANLPASAHESFCGQKLVMPTLFKAQNGLEIHENTAIAVTGCPKALTRSQKLAAALKACRKKHNKAKRAKCEKAARKAYGARTSRRSSPGRKSSR